MTARMARLLFWLLSVAVLFGCRPATDELAKLEAAHGTVDRDTASKQGSWTAAALGAGFLVGDAVRTARGAAAQLRLSDASGLKLQVQIFFVCILPKHFELRVCKHPIALDDAIFPG